MKNKLGNLKQIGMGLGFLGAAAFLITACGHESIVPAAPSTTITQSSGQSPLNGNGSGGGGSSLADQANQNPSSVNLGTTGSPSPTPSSSPVVVAPGCTLNSVSLALKSGPSYNPKATPNVVGDVTLTYTLLNIPSSLASATFPDATHTVDFRTVSSSVSGNSYIDGTSHCLAQDFVVRYKYHYVDKNTQYNNQLFNFTYGANAGVVPPPLTYVVNITVATPGQDGVAAQADHVFTGTAGNPNATPVGF